MSCGLGLGYSGLATAAAPLAGYGLDLGSNGLAGYHGLGSNGLAGYHGLGSNGLAGYHGLGPNGLAGYHGLGSNGLAGYHGLGLDLGAYGHLAHAGLAAATPLSAHGFGLGAYGAYSHLAHAGLAAAPLNGLGLGACGSNGLW